MLISNCAVCGKKKLTFMKNKELHNFNDQFKMNKTINTFLLTGDKFIPELYLKHLGVTYSACRRFTKHCEKIQKFREAGNLNRLYENNQTKLALLMMQHIVIVKTQQKELFQRRLYKKELMKLLGIVTMMDIIEHQQVWCISFLIKNRIRIEANHS